MEYEQLENANKLLHKCILTQDVGGFYEMLHPDAVLVTHFPYPEADDTCCETPAESMLSPAIAAIRAEQLGKLTPKQRRMQLLREQAALRARQRKRYEDHLASRMEAATGSGGGVVDGGGSTKTTVAAAAAPGVAAAIASDITNTAGEPKTGTTTKKVTVAAQGTGKPPAGTGRSATHTSSASESAVTTALHGSREHRGLTFFFNQPAPLPWMTLGSGSAMTGPGAGGAGAGSGQDPWYSASAGDKQKGAGVSAPHRRSVPADASGKAGGAAATANAATMAGKTNPNAVTAAAGSGSLEAAVAADYGDFVDVSEGRLLVCARFYQLLTWLNAGSCVADTDTQLDPRKSILQEAEVLPPPPEPRTPQEAYAQLGPQHTDRNQQVSRLTVIWGREHLMFCDQLHVDDGLIICIHRRLLTLPEMLERFPTRGQQWTLAQKTEKIRQALRDLYGIKGRRVAAVSHTLPLLDFSFVEVGAQLGKLLESDAVPASGRRHVCRSERPQGDPRLAQGVFLNADNDPSKAGQSTRTLIKAKNKRGEEEAYEFAKGGRQRYQVFDDISGAAGGARGEEESAGAYASIAHHGNSARGQTANSSPMTGIGGAGLRPFKFDAGTLRISGCQLRLPASGSEFTEVGRAGAGASASGAGTTRPLRFITLIRSLVANAMFTLHTIDLSDNALTTIPDFSLLPLRKLLLHGNRISDWSEVEERVCSLPYLTSVTLHGNPIADSDPNYRVQALSRLLRSPSRRVVLRQLDFVALTGQDLNRMGVRQ